MAESKADATGDINTFPPAATARNSGGSSGMHRQQAHSYAQAANPSVQQAAFLGGSQAPTGTMPSAPFAPVPGFFYQADQFGNLHPVPVCSQNTGDFYMRGVDPIGGVEQAKSPYMNTARKARMQPVGIQSW